MKTNAIGGATTKSTNELLADLTELLELDQKARGVKAASALLPDNGQEGEDGEGPIVEKGFRAQEADAAYVDPVRKSFERLAKAMPSTFGHLGVKAALDNPYAVLRAKNADGSYVMKNHELSALITATLGVNSEDPIAAGALTIGEWASKSGNPEAAIEGAFEQAVQSKAFGENGNMVRKALDTTVGAALIRVDIEPLLREAFNRVFPAFDVFGKIPANGIKHTWNQITAPGTATLLGELGDFSGTATNNTYSQVQSTNIAVAASQREIGLKAQWASMQSGMNFNLGGSSNVEIMGALVAIANTMQAQIFQGNSTTGSKTLDDEEGLTNTLGFDGLRQQLMSGSYSINKGSDTYLTILRRAIGQLYDAGADMNEVCMFMSIGANNALDAELETFYQFLKTEAGQPTPTNFSAAGLSMLNGVMARVKPVPSGGAQANGIGYYTYSAAATEDIYIVDPNGIKLPYIGSPGPTILELPTGWGNHLSNTFVPFIMMGLAVYVKLFNRKVRIAKTTI